MNKQDIQYQIRWQEIRDTASTDRWLSSCGIDEMSFRKTDALLLKAQLAAHQTLVSHRIPMPNTAFANSPHDTESLIDLASGAPLVLKLLESTQGKGVLLAESRKAAAGVISAFQKLNAPFIVQEFVKEAAGKDLRCFVVKGKVVAAIERTASKGEFRSNIHMGGSAKKVKITAEERRLAIKASRILNLAVAGVDIIRSNKGPLLLEVNSSPGLEGIEAATGKDIASEMIIAIEKKLKYNRSSK